jgi:hypothetical protein
MIKKAQDKLINTLLVTVAFAAISLTLWWTTPPDLRSDARVYQLHLLIAGMLAVTLISMWFRKP